METTLREPAVAGAFYPGTASALEQELQQLVTVSEERHQLLACIAPHAGYVYSGGVAGELFGHLDLPKRVVVLGPNHTGVGARVAVAPHERWRTPLGEQPVDVEFARLLVERCPDASFDENAHWREHSLEVQIPFMLARRPDVTFVPLCLSHLGLEQSLELGQVLASLIEELGEDVGLVASSDMSHYLEDAQARSLDRLAIDEALRRDPKSLYQVVHREGITMCGVVPATVAIEAANRLGANDAHLVAYATSGDVSGDLSAVVGYAGICVHR
jgi:AmmeMemoRadiSam system protein B